jgi:hypothetical protein
VGTTEWIVVVLVVGGRLALPLTIPYFPLVGVVACLILDSIDQSIFQQFPAIPLDGYQSYDKALDIYYLSIAYMSTMRNWTNQTAFRMAQFLFYYRLVGALLFELTGIRAILFIFPNTFEYFFLFVEAVRLRWDWSRMGKWTVIIATVLIWVFIKLPQEWWIHIAELDMTDFIKEELFGVSANASWGAAIANRPWVLIAAIAAFALIGYVGYWIVTRKAPPGDHGPSLRASPLPEECRGAELYRTARATKRFLDWALLEKTFLVTLVMIIFATMMPGLEARPLHVALSVLVFVLVNTFVSQVMARRGRSWRTVAVQLVTMFVVNLIIVLALAFIARVFSLRDTRISIPDTLFFTYLLTLIIVLFDRYRTVYTVRRVARTPSDDEGAAAVPSAGG